MDLSLLAETQGTPEDFDKSEEWQQRFMVSYSIRTILQHNVPELTPEQLYQITEEIVDAVRPGEAVIETIRRWIPDDWKLALRRDEKTGALLRDSLNISIMLENHPMFRGAIRLNVYTKNIEFTNSLVMTCLEDPDQIATKLQDWFIANEDVVFQHIDIARRLVVVAYKNTFDPIKSYLDNLKWDGIKRVESDEGWLSMYSKTSTEEYAREVGKKFLISAVARIYEPGAKADTVLIVEGDQGEKKSSLFEALGGDWYAEGSFVLGDKDSKQVAAAAWIIELPDMASMKKSEINAMKAFFSTRVDTFRVPYGKAPLRYARRCIFTATTNDERYLSDPTGARRFWPVKCSGVSVKKLMEDRDQIWAEAVQIYKAAFQCNDCKKSSDVVWNQIPRCFKHSWWLSKDLELESKKQVKKRHIEDAWYDLIEDFVKNPVKSLGHLKTDQKVEITTTNCLLYGIGKKPHELDAHRDSIRVGYILKDLGYKPDTNIDKSEGKRVYRKTETLNSNTLAKF